MNLTSPTELVVGVTETGDRLTFHVKSRTTKTLWIVDLERREGLGICNCYDYTMNKNRNCWHLTQARKFLACRVAQAIIQRHQPK